MKKTHYNYTPSNIRRKTLIFHSTWLDIVNGLSNDAYKLNTLVAILEYGLTGVRPANISLQLDAILDYTQEKIEKDYNRFTEYIKARNQSN